MAKYILKRVLWLIVIVLAVSVVIFSLMFIIDGDPARSILSVNASQEDIDALRDKLGLNDPYWVQLVRFLKQTFLEFDIGTSYRTRKPVLTEIFERIGYTLTIASVSTLVATVLGIYLGVVAATNQYSWKDNTAIFLSLFCVSMPEFWFALMLVSIFALQLGWLPPLGIDSWKSYILPCISCLVGGTANIARQTRSSMLGEIRQDYITTAKAKGQTKEKIITRHALKNSLIPVITVIGSLFGTQLGGSVVVEQIFSIPGVGSYMMTAIGFRDYPAVRGGVLVIAICFSAVILLIDIVYVLVDPRFSERYNNQ